MKRTLKDKANRLAINHNNVLTVLRGDQKQNDPIMGHMTSVELIPGKRTEEFSSYLAA